MKRSFVIVAETNDHAVLVSIVKAHTQLGAVQFAKREILASDAWEIVQITEAMEWTGP